jgi:DNA-binding LacI/PurR family transcriptional regulator
MNNQLKYTKVKELLRQQIGTRYPVGSKIPSTTALHKELGISAGTVNRALQDLVAEGVVERFEGRGTFVARDDKDIGFLWPDATTDWFKTPYPSAILHVAEAEAESQGKHLLVRAMRDYEKPEFVTPGATKVAGVLVLFSWCHQAIVEYHRRNIPVVLVDPLVRTTGVPFVTSDHFSASREAVLHLVRLGHRRIVHVTVDSLSDTIPYRERVFGYENAMHEASLGEIAYIHRTSPIEGAHLPPEEEAAVRARAVEKLLEMIDRTQPTACCCFDDIVAAWVIRTCLDRGIRVPDQMSVVGINDNAMAEQIWPTLTTVHVPVQEIARVAVRMLDTLIQEGRLTGDGVILPVRLVERASTKALHATKQAASGAELAHVC